jgi:Skp family chaperone for outer membrane proteins
VNAKKAKLDAMPEGDAKIAAREEIAREILEAEAWFKFSRGELDREKSLMWQDLYQSMKTEAGKLAEAQGLDLVLVNDSLPEIKTTTESNVSAEAMVLQQITARRVVFASQETDVTDQLITRMNNAFAAH